MREATVQSVEMLLRADGADDALVTTVRELCVGGGMVPVPVACRQLGVSRWTVRRAVLEHGIAKQTRMGSGGSLVDLGALRVALKR